MDLIYAPEVLCYGALRNPQYRDYEQPWNKDYFNCATVNNHHRQVEKPSSKDTCHLCKESKRRTLAAYIRGKSRKNSCSGINEVDEEDDDKIEETHGNSKVERQSKSTEQLQKVEYKSEKRK